MRICILIPGKEPEFVEAEDCMAKAREVVGDMIDFTKARVDGKLCTMMVDDLGHPKGLPVNGAATLFYWGACIPGTTHEIRGPAVIFDGLLP